MQIIQSPSRGLWIIQIALWIALSGIILTLWLIFCEKRGAAPTDETLQLPGIEDYYKYTSFILYYEKNGTLGRTRYTVYQSNDLSYDPHFNTHLPTAIFIHGFQNTQNSKYVKELVKSFVLHNKNYNMVSLDWDYFALLDYSKVASRVAKNYGKWCGQVVYNSSVESDGSLKPSTLYLIGASLGVHVAGGMALEIYEKSGSKVGRLTGLDPAGPNFENGVPNAESSMTKDDAEFCDIWHGDAGIYGMKLSMGHVDFWPNNGTHPQNGCPISRDAVSQNDADTCSHKRPLQYFVESVRNFNNATEFWAMKKHLNGTWDPKDLMPMGINCPSTARGNYYLRTAAESPFSLGMDGITDLNNNVCC